MLSLLRAQVRSLVRELRSRMPRSAAKKKEVEEGGSRRARRDVTTEERYREMEHYWL